MKDHICFSCTKCRKRKVGNFIETNCDEFPAVWQQVKGNVSRCERFKLNLTKVKGDKTDKAKWKLKVEAEEDRLKVVE